MYDLQHASFCSRQHRFNTASHHAASLIVSIHDLYDDWHCFACLLWHDDSKTLCQCLAATIELQMTGRSSCSLYARQIRIGALIDPLLGLTSWKTKASSSWKLTLHKWCLFGLCLTMPLPALCPSPYSHASHQVLCQVDDADVSGLACR